MGHALLGRLFHSKAWKDVIALIATGADVSVVAEAVIKASENAFDAVQNDKGFKNTVAYLVELALAMSQENKQEALRELGISLTPETSPLDVVDAAMTHVDQIIQRERCRCDFGEKAVEALSYALTKHLQNNQLSLWSESGADVLSALNEIKKPAVFAGVSRDFFDNLTHNSVQYFLSKTAGTHVGDGLPFASLNQLRQFEDAMQLHCYESSKIVEQFSADWFSKNRYENGGKISPDKAGKFGWYAINKMRSEISGHHDRYDCDP